MKVGEGEDGSKIGIFLENDFWTPQAPPLLLILYMDLTESVSI